MKRLFKILTIAAFAGIAASCAPDPVITIGRDVINLSSNQSNSQNITFNTNYDWTAKSNDSWLTVSPASGVAGDAMLNIKSEANATYGERTGTISITYGSMVKTITVIQPQTNGLLVGSNEYVIDCNGGTVNVVVSVNVGYIYEFPTLDWIRETTTKGLVDHVHTFVVDPNDSYDPREVTFTFSDAFGKLTQTVTIRQLQKNALILSRDNFKIHSNGGDFDVIMQTNIDYEITISEDWIKQVEPQETKGLVKYNFCFSVDPNESPEDRDAIIVFKDKVSSFADTVSVIQTANTGIVVDPLETTVSYMGGTVSFNVKADSELELVESEEEWVHAVSFVRNSDGTYTLVVNVDVNKIQNDRYASVGLRDKESHLTEYANIIQEGWPNILTITTEDWVITVPSFEGLYVEGTIDWGDGTTEPYEEAASHLYSKEGRHTVTITLHDVNIFHLDNTYGITELDLSRF